MNPRPRYSPMRPQQFRLGPKIHVSEQTRAFQKKLCFRVCYCQYFRPPSNGPGSKRLLIGRCHMNPLPNPMSEHSRMICAEQNRKAFESFRTGAPRPRHQRRRSCSHVHCYGACAIRREPHAAGAQAGPPAAGITEQAAGAAACTTAAQSHSKRPPCSLRRGAPRPGHQKC